MNKAIAWFASNHVAANLSQVGLAVEEALGKYMGWEVYHHRRP